VTRLQKLQHRLERGELELGQELEMFKHAIDMVDRKSRAIQAAIVAKVEAELQAQQARQEQHAVYSELQDEELQD